MTVSLNGRVRAILDLAFLAILVVLPATSGSLDVSLLALPRAPTEEDDDFISVLAKIYAIAWTEIDFELEYACANALHIRRISQLKTCQRTRNLRFRYWVESPEPNC